MKTKTLLKKALESKYKRKNIEPSDEQIELAIAFIEDKISLNQVAMAAYGKAVNQTSASHLVCRCPRRACSQGKLIVKK